jgi:hypothetical protein
MRRATPFAGIVKFLVPFFVSGLEQQRNGQWR